VKGKVMKVIRVGKLDITEDGALFYGILCCAITILNSIFCTNTTVSILLGFAETVFLMYLLLFRSAGDFICYLILFSATVIESSLFATGSQDNVMYSMLNLPKIHFYHLFVFLAVAYLKAVSSRKKGSMLLYKDISLGVIILFVLGCLVTVITLLLNDNGVFEIKGMMRFVIQDTYNTFWVCMIFAILWICLNNDDNFKIRFKGVLLGILSGVTVSTVFLIFAGNVIKQRSSMYLIAPLSLFYAPGLILFYFSEKCGRAYLAIGLLAAVIQVNYTLGIAGAWWIFFASCMGVFMIKVFNGAENRRKRNWLILIGVVLFLITISTLIYVDQDITNSIKPANYQVAYKLSTFRELLNFSGGLDHWYLRLGESIGTRVEEMVNILLEMLKKPWYIVFGKGYGGSVPHEWGVYNWNVYGSSFPDVMINHEIYSWFHMGLAEIFSNFGLLGICIIFKVLKTGIEEVFHKRGNCWIVIGMLWMLLLLYIFRSMTIGIGCLCYGIYLRKERNGIKQESMLERSVRCINKSRI